MRLIVAAVAILLTVPGLAQAYVGPGLGLGAIVVILGILVSLGLAVFALVWYPLKRRRAQRQAAREQKSG